MQIACLTEDSPAASQCRITAIRSGTQCSNLLRKCSDCCFSVSTSSATFTRTILVLFPVQIISSRSCKLPICGHHLQLNRMIQAYHPLNSNIYPDTYRIRCPRRIGNRHGFLSILRESCKDSISFFFVICHYDNIEIIALN